MRFLPVARPEQVRPGFVLRQQRQPSSKAEGKCQFVFWVGLAFRLHGSNIFIEQSAISLAEPPRFDKQFALKMRRQLRNRAKNAGSSGNKRKL
jgi:hypothetical protein